MDHPGAAVDRIACEGRHIAGINPRPRSLHQPRPTGRATPLPEPAAAARTAAGIAPNTGRERLPRPGQWNRTSIDPRTNAGNTNKRRIRFTHDSPRRASHLRSVHEETPRPWRPIRTPRTTAVRPSYDRALVPLSSRNPRARSMTTSRKSLYSRILAATKRKRHRNEIHGGGDGKDQLGRQQTYVQIDWFGGAGGVLANARDAGGVKSVERWPLRPERPTQARTPPTAHVYARDASRGLPRFDYGNGPDVLPALRQPPSYRVPI